MQRESSLGRVLWIAILVILGGYVAADFVRSPFLSPSGSAAVRPAELTLWVPATEAGREAEVVAREAAAGLVLQGRTVAVKSLPGGSSQAVSEFLSRPQGERGSGLLLVTTTTLADLAHDRRDHLVPGASEEAVAALDLLRRAAPLGVLASEPLALAVSRGSQFGGTAELLRSMRRAPWKPLFGISDDTWSRVQLAALVQRAEVNGHIRFGVFHSGAEAAQAVETSGANTALATRGSLQEDVRSGGLRELPWPFDGQAPRAWMALVASPGAGAPEVARLRGWVGELTRAPRWRQLQREAGRQSGDPSATRLRRLLRSAAAQANRLEAIAQRVEQR
jgi:tripartite-type tricarboxylate transporter receptor subunit TctC